MSTLLNRLSPLRMVKPLGKEEKESYGFSNPSAELTLTIIAETESASEAPSGEDGGTNAEMKTETRTLRFGRRASEEDDFPARSSESPYYVEVSRWSAGDFAEWTRSDFIVSDE